MPILFLCFVSLALADHLPENKLARGKSDSVLCGIDVYKTPMAQAIQKLGPPSNITDVPRSGKVVGERDYDWRLYNSRIEVASLNGYGDKTIPYSVEVWGKRSTGQIGRTGRGLKLGDTIKDVRRIYGNHFLLEYKGGKLQITIQWEDETTLTLGFDGNGHLNYMQLLASE